MRRLHFAVVVALLLRSAAGQSQSVAAPGFSVGEPHVQVIGQLDSHADAHVPVAALDAGPAAAMAPYRFYPLAGNLWQDINIGNFVDLDLTSGIRDYRCTEYTYDGHRGHDSGVLSFRQQDIGVPIFAALDGIVTNLRDGEFDQQTTMSNAPANFVELDHGGGHRTLYLHMKKNTVAVGLGQVVTAGTQLGLTGSSGSSTGPHLHFESRLNGVAFEPSTGNCGPGASLWTQQPDPPSSPTLYEVVFSPSPHTGSLGYPFDTNLRIRNFFVSGSTVTFYPRVRFGDVPPQSSYRMQFLRPDGSIAIDFGNNFNNPTWWSSAWWWVTVNAVFNTPGEWRFRFLVNNSIVGEVPIPVIPAGGTLGNRAPHAISAVLDPAIPRIGDAQFCRVQNSQPVYYRDPDFDTMRYRYRWTVNNGVIRDVITGAMADAIWKGSLTQGAHVSCSITPMDGTTSASTATISSIVGQGLPAMSVDRTALGIGAVSTGTGFSAVTAPQAVRLTQSAPGPVTWAATANVPWLVVTPGSGSGPATLNVSAQPLPGLTGTLNGAITLTFSGAANSTAQIAVTLRVVTAQTAAAPNGSFDTPLNGASNVAGSIAVTGWATDDVEVTAVRIFRNAVAGEPDQPIFIGDATLVEGARPDVAALFPTAPRNTRAGWGYLMLTNFLPNLGNGTFTLTAIAYDADGHSTFLGAKTITCSNSAAIHPFGAIDTPVQGGVVGGVINNFGWVLSRPSRADPPAGGTVRIVIDGAVIGTVPSGWTSRPDLTAMFPPTQYPGINTALAVAPIDTSSLANGVHTIAWTVVDKVGNAAGIGSRYFTVSNNSALRAAPPPAAVMRVPFLPDPITGRRGFDLDVPLVPLDRHASGVLTLAAEELDRIELRVQAMRGFLRTAIGDLPLPIGSRLDPLERTFTWLAGPGFLGAYDLVFETPRGIETVRVTLFPQGTFTRPQVIVDLPSQDEVVSGPFVIAGWAVDPDARSGNGIEAVHVWAYPADGSQPIFLGATTPDGERPDVAAIYGTRARYGGYGITASALPPGRYTLAVFGWSELRGGFLTATTRQVIAR